MIDELKVTLKLLGEEFNVIEFQNCYIVLKSLKSFSNYNDEIQFSDQIRTIIVKYLIEQNYNFEYVNSKNINCTKVNNNVIVNFLYSETKKYTGFLIYKEED